jgi:hypothetical protein
VKGFEPSTFSLGKRGVARPAEAAESGHERPEATPTRESEIEDDEVTGRSFE